MKVVADGFEFQFPGAIDAFVFDEKDPQKAMFHGVPMKAVDIIAEFDTEYVYVEVKEYPDPSGEEKPGRNFNELKEYLKYKFRDSLLYRYAEQKTDKPVRYICLINFDNALNSKMQKDLKKELPTGKASPRWQQALATNCNVVNMEKWNKNFSQWPVKHMPVTE